MICPACGQLIHGNETWTKIDAFEVLGDDRMAWVAGLPRKKIPVLANKEAMEIESFYVHDQPCGENLRKQLAKIKNPGGKKLFMLRLFKKLSE